MSTPPALSIQKLLADKTTHALAQKLMDADLAGNASGTFEYAEAKHLDRTTRAAYAKLIGDPKLAAKYAADPEPAAPPRPARISKAHGPAKGATDPVALFGGLETSGLADRLSAYLEKHPKERRPLAQFFAALGPLPEQPLAVSGRARNELFADASLIARGLESTAGGKKFPAGGAGDVLAAWLTDSITNTGSATRVDDPSFPRDFTRVAAWLSGRAAATSAPEARPAAPGTDELLAAFAKVGDPVLDGRVATYLGEHPEEVPRLVAFFRAQGVPHGGSALDNQSRLELYADVMMLLRGQATTPEGLAFPSPGLGQVLADWINERFENTGSARASDPKYPWTMVSLAEWLVRGAFSKASDDFWRAIGPNL